MKILLDIIYGVVILLLAAAAIAWDAPDGLYIRGEWHDKESQE